MQIASARSGSGKDMKLTIERAALLKALGHVQSAVERRNTIPILSNVLIEAEGDQVSFRATDLDIEVIDRATAMVTLIFPTSVKLQKRLLARFQNMLSLPPNRPFRLGLETRLSESSAKCGRMANLQWFPILNSCAKAQLSVILNIRTVLSLAATIRRPARPWKCYIVRFI